MIGFSFPMFAQMMNLARIELEAKERVLVIRPNLTAIGPTEPPQFRCVANLFRMHQGNLKVANAKREPALKRTHSKRCRAVRRRMAVAKRLECVRFSAAFGTEIGAPM